MTYVEKHDISLTTVSAGTVTAYTSAPLRARILAVQYIPATSNAIAATGVLAISTELTLRTVLGCLASGAFTRAPRPVTHTATGGLVSGGSDAVYAAGERVKVTVVGGGSVKSGTVRIVTG